MKVDCSDLKVLESGTYISVEWKMINAIHTPATPCASLLSPTFTFGGLDDEVWNLECWPNGKAVPMISNRNNITLSALGCVSVSVWCHSDQDMNISCLLSIVSGNHELSHTKNCRESRKYESRRAWEFDSYIDRRALLDRREGLLPDDVLTLFCKICILPDGPASVIRQQKEFKAQLLNELSKFALDTDMSDVEIIVDGVRFPAHKLILGARSPVFKAMFHHEMKEKAENVVAVSDLDKEVVEELLRFMYTGSSPRFAELAEKLLVAADKYQIEGLKELCALQLVENLTQDNVCNTLSVAFQYSLPELRTACFDFMASRMDLVLDTSGYRDMLVTFPELTTEAFRYYVKKTKKDV